MNLYVDVGNSLLKWGVCIDGHWTCGRDSYRDVGECVSRLAKGS